MGVNASDDETTSQIKLASKVFALRLEGASQEYRAQLRDWAVMMRAAVADGVMDGRRVLAIADMFERLALAKDQGNKS